MTFSRNLYRWFFGPRTIQIEGVSLLIGLVLAVIGHLAEQDSLVTIGLWCAAPFLITLAVSLFILAPWFALRDRRRRSGTRS